MSAVSLKTQTRYTIFEHLFQPFQTAGFWRNETRCLRSAAPRPKMSLREAIGHTLVTISPDV